MRVAVVGGGPGSVAMAGHLTLLGHDVRFWARNRRKLAWLFHDRTVELTGRFNESVMLAGASDDLGATVDGAEVVMIPLPALAHEDIANRLAEHISDSQLCVTSSMSGMGSVVLNRQFAMRGRRALTAELPGLPYGARFAGEGVVNVPLVADISSNNVYGRGVGVFPAATRDSVIDKLGELYTGVYAAENSLACALQAWGPVLHPALMILNLTSIENFTFWDPHEEGTTESVFKIVKALDNERKALQQGWGFQVTDSRVATEYYEGHRKVYDVWPDFREMMVPWAWKDRLDVRHRYLTEDAKFGMVLRLSAAKVVGVPMPLTEAIVRLGGALNDEDFQSTGRTLESIGLTGGRNEMLQILQQGWPSSVEEPAV